MKIENPPLKKITARLKKISLFLILISLISSGCKFSYDDIHFDNFADQKGEIKGFPSENYGYLVYDIAGKKIVKGHNIHKEFTPASVTKLFTALFAYDTLGNDYTFSTTLSYNGSISGGILKGDLYLKGTGEPELTLEGLLTLVNSLKSEKITEVKGNFYFDESSFAPRDSLDKDMPEDAYYNAGISPLSFNSSIVYALQERNSNWKIVSANFLPSVPSFQSYIYTEKLPYPYLKYKSAGDKDVWGFPQENLWENRQQLPVKHPGLYTAQTFRELCSIRGIKIPSPVKGKMGEDTEEIANYTGRPLTQIIKNMLFTSNNLTAELINTIASESYENGEYKSESMEKFYNSSFTELNWKNFRIKNASGLTNLNKATPAQTSAVLLYIENLNDDKFRLEEILPLSGWEGTMKGRLDQPVSAFRVYGKTGSIFYASGLAGIFYASSGKKYIFTVYINDSARRSGYDSKGEKSADDLNQGGSWSRKAAGSTDEFIQKMIKEL